MDKLMLLIAGILEITWAVSMKMSEGFTRPLPSLITAVGYILSAVFLSMALKNLPLSTTYAVWTGMGIAGTAILGIFLFSESVSPLQCAFMAMILIGIVGLELAG